MLRKSKAFLLFSVIPIIFIAIITTFYLTNRFDTQIFLGIFYGFLFPTFNFFLGILSIHYGFDRSDKVFLIIVFGGLIVRLFMMLLMIVLTLKLLFVSLNSFIFTTFIFYFYYLVVEIFILTQKKNLSIKP